MDPAHRYINPVHWQLATVYAEALLGAAAKAGQVPAVLEQLDALVRRVLVQLPAFQAFLETPRIGPEEKCQVLDRCFQGKMAPVLLNALKVMARHGRLGLVPVLFQAAQHLYNQQRGVVEVVMGTAHPPSAELQQLVQQKLRATLGREVVLLPHVQQRLIGGVVLRIGDTVYDGSIRGRLKRLHRQVLGHSADLVRSALERFVQ